MLIDTHCHLHDREFFSKEAAEKALEKAHKNGVEKIICIGTDIEDSMAAKDFAESHENVFWTFGVHPENILPKAENLADFWSGTPVAIGEIGLDYHYSLENKAAQIKLFEALLQLAQDKNLPISFHVREAFDDFFPVVRNFPKIRGVVHSFTDSKKNLKRILNETDFYIGVNGLATYSTLPMPPLERILLETDAPFLAPIPHRGETNEPAYIKDIVLWLSDKLQMPEAEIATRTTKNAEALFVI